MNNEEKDILWDVITLVLQKEVDYLKQFKKDVSELENPEYWHCYEGEYRKNIQISLNIIRIILELNEILNNMEK